MSISVTCVCGKMYHFKDEFAGRRAKCAACGAIVRIPGDRALAPAAAPTPGSPSAAETPAAAVASSPPAALGRTGLFVGLFAAALVVCAGIGLLGYALFRPAPSPKPSADAPVQSRQQAAVPTSSSNQPQNIPYPEKTLDMAMDMGVLQARGYMPELKGGGFGETADVTVADGLLVTKVPVQFLKAYLNCTKTHRDATDTIDKSKTPTPIPRFLALSFVAQNIGEALALGIGKSRDKASAMEKVNWDAQLARFHAGLVPPPAKILSAVWLFSPGRFSSSAPLRPGYASYLQLLERFEPAQATTTENAIVAAEDLVWTKELGLSDGTPKTLPDARRTMQQYILESIGFEIGDVGNPDAAKREAAIRNLEDAKALVRKAYAD